MTRLLAGTLIANLLLLMPVWLQYLSLSAGWLALEALIIVPLLSLPPHRWAGPVRVLAVLAVLATLLLGLGNAATQHVLGRPLNVYLDWPLLASVYDLLDAALGRPAAVLSAGAALGLAVLTFLGLERAAARLQGVARTTPSLAVAMGMLLSGSVALAGGVAQSRIALGSAPMVNTFALQTEQLVASRRARNALEAALSDESRRARALDGLAGRDVILVFVESYGVDVLERSPWRGWLAPRLSAMEEELARHGLHAASGVMSSPVRGGQSWLAHATAMSGLNVDNQYRYRLILADHHSTLVDDFRATGHRTVAIAPAITAAWPEGRAYGFDAVYAAADLGYAGPAFNWVTMPDQYTLYRFQQGVRQADDAPLFAEISLISSHAPWTPILPVLDWRAVGDGSVFHAWREAGPPPQVLWRDLSRVRENHARALDYTLSVVTQWAAAFLGREDLLLVMGDHPAAPVISGDRAGHAVPVHVISGERALLSPFREKGFVPGTRPPPMDGRPPPSMALLRDWLRDGFARRM